MYVTQAICDVSRKTADHCAAKFHIPLSTTDPEDLFNHPDIDVIFILTSDEFHAPYTVSALNAGKHVMVEKPITLSLKSGQTIIDAERAAPNNARVFVGYMRRYAPSLTAFRREISTIKSIRHARVRDIIGPNAYFIGQSGTFPSKFLDDISSTAAQDRRERLRQLLEEAWGAPYDTLSTSQLDYCWLLANLGSHGLGVMRDVLQGLPESVVASTDNTRWFTTMFDYRNKIEPHGHFTCVYEVGIDNVPRFDSHVVVYGEDKTVSIQYDTPYVKGLGITVEIDEMNEHGERCHRSLQTSYEDAYTAELKELYASLVEGKPIVTTATDAMEDLKLFKMMLDKYPEHKRKAGEPKNATQYNPTAP